MWKATTFALAVVLVPTSALAQQVTTSFADLAGQGLVSVGDKIRINCDVEGTGRYEEYDAKVVDITEATITIENTEQMFFDHSTATVPADRVASIHRTRSSRALVGLGIGAAAGFGIGYALGESYCENERGQNCDGRLQASMGGGVALLGMATGAGVGYFFKRGGELIYSTPSSFATRNYPLTYSITPIGSRQRRGVLFTLTW